MIHTLILLIPPTSTLSLQHYLKYSMSANKKFHNNYYNHHRQAVVIRSRTATCLFASNNDITMMPSGDDYTIRDWKPGDGTFILDFLKNATFTFFYALNNKNNKGFDPEGSLDLDVVNENLLLQSYGSGTDYNIDNESDNGCFLVATNNNNDNNDIIGTAGLIVGTPVTYYKSGSSMSTATITGAMRRVCVKIDNNNNITKYQKLLKNLISTIEKRAQMVGATKLIVLAYNNNYYYRTNLNLQENSSNYSYYIRPTPTLLESLGYQELPLEDIKGIQAVQYQKQLFKTIKNNNNTNISQVEKQQQVQKRIQKTVMNANIDSSTTQSTNNQGTILSVATITSIFAIVLLSIMLLVGNITGMDSFSSMESIIIHNNSNDNGGIGTPLSTIELQQLLQDEKLQRTEITTDTTTTTTTSGSDYRKWEDLSNEERREEAVLMKLIQGQDIRIKSK